MGTDTELQEQQTPPTAEQGEAQSQNPIDSQQNANQGEGVDVKPNEKSAKQEPNKDEGSGFGYQPPVINLGSDSEKKEEVGAQTVSTTSEAQKETTYVRLSKEFDELDEDSRKMLNYAIKNGARTTPDIIAKIQEFAQLSAAIPTDQISEIVEDESKAISVISEDLKIKNPIWSKERIALTAKKEFDRIQYEEDKLFQFEDIIASINQHRAKALEGLDSNIFGEFKAQQESNIPDLPYDSFQHEYFPKLAGSEIKVPELTVKREDGSLLSTFSQETTEAVEKGANQMFANYLYNATVWNGKEWVLPETFRDGDKEIPASEWVQKVRQESLQVIEFMEKGRNFDRYALSMEKELTKQRDNYIAEEKKKMEKEFNDKLKQYTGLDKPPIINEGGNGETKPLVHRPTWRD